MDELKAKARKRGLWNLFLAHHPEGAGPDQPPVRPAGRAERPLLPDPRGAELRGPRHRQHGGAGRVRHQGAAGPVAAAAARRRDPVGLLHDRAGRCLLRCHEHLDQHRARRRRLRDQRPEVVVIGRDGSPLPDPDRDGQEQPGGGPAPAAIADPGAQGHAGRRHPARHARLRLHRRHPRRARRGRVHRRPGAGRERHLRARARASPSPRPGSGPAGSTTACARSARPSGRGADVPPGHRAGRLGQAAGRAGRHPGLDRRVAGADRGGQAARAQDRVADGHGRATRARTPRSSRSRSWCRR